MIVMTPDTEYKPTENDVCVFLAGGITGCPDWQKEIIKKLDDRCDTATLVVMNPRRENFPIHDPHAARDQIAWEYKNLERADIFSMYFCESVSDQPICMYELGRNLLRMQMRFPADWQNRIIISVEDGYKRKQDVLIQTDHALEVDVVLTQPCLEVLMDYHAAYIWKAYQKLRRFSG